jgi:hypothetical protein
MADEVVDGLAGFWKEKSEKLLSSFLTFCWILPELLFQFKP